MAGVRWGYIPAKPALVTLARFNLFLGAQQYYSIGMLLSPLAERHDWWFCKERDCLALARSGDRRPLRVVQRIPEALCLAIENQEHILVDVTADAELIDLPVLLASVNHGQLGKRSPPHCYRLATEFVIDKLVIVEQTDRIGPCLFSNDISGDLDIIGYRRSLFAPVMAGSNLQ